MRKLYCVLVLILLICVGCTIDEVDNLLENEGYIVTEDDIDFDKETNTILGYEGDMTELKIPEKINIQGEEFLIKSIGDKAFEHKGITKLVLPDTLEEIGWGAFLGNEIEELVIPDSVVNIGDVSFSGNKIKKLTLGNNVKEIGFIAFNNNEITKLEIPSSVEEIGICAFEFNNIETLILNEGLKKK